MSPRTSQQRTPASRLRRVLWADFTAGAVVGALLLALSIWLEAIYSIPRSVLLVMGAAGLLYACLAWPLLPVLFHLRLWSGSSAQPISCGLHCA
jgi:hypothetical protein